MSTSQDIKAQRGTKRTCQNTECGSRFYDLNRDPITCPICGAVFEVKPAVPAPVVQRPQRPAPKKPIPEAPRPEDAVPVEAEELAAVEEAEEPVAGEGEDETFLVEEEESSDVSGIIDAPIEDTDEKT
jgi:uncharacterized protein (TIGR02300 family)